MMFWKRTTAAILGGAILCSGAALAVTAKPISTEITDTAADAVAGAPEVLPERNLYYGRITELMCDEQTGKVISIAMESEAYGAYVFHVDDATLMLDSGNGIRTGADQLKVGDGVYVFHSPVMTMSLPPQSYAEAIVTNIPADAGSAMLHTVEDVQKNADGSVTVKTDRGSLLLTIGKDAQYGDYIGRMIMGADDLHVGTRIFAWYGAVAESDPAQAFTDHVVIAPASEQDDQPLENLPEAPDAAE